MSDGDIPLVGVEGVEGKEQPDGQVSDRKLTRRERKALMRRRKRTRGVVRRVDPWSVFKVSVVFYVAMYFILLVAGVLLWSAATATGFRGNVESFIASLIESGEFKFVADELFRASVVCGALMAAMGTGANVLFAVLYNLISDVVGGLVVVVEEKPGRRALEAAAAATADAPATTGRESFELDVIPERAAAASSVPAIPAVAGSGAGAAAAASATAPAVGDFGFGGPPIGPGPAPTGGEGRAE